jgi:hypothetical protein
MRLRAARVSSGKKNKDQQSYYFGARTVSSFGFCCRGGLYHNCDKHSLNSGIIGTQAA